MILEIPFLMPYSLSSFISKACSPLVRNRKKQALEKFLGLVLCVIMSYVLTDSYNSVRFSMARKSVTSSAYSISAPTASPRARRVTLIPAGLRRRERYIDVASPSAVALVATITSETSLSMRRVMRLLRLISSGLIPFIGEMRPCKT